MTIEHYLQVPPDMARQRLDKAVSALLPQYSRSRLQGWIKGGELTVDGDFARQKDKVMGGEEIQIQAQEATTDALPEAIPLDIVHEDDAIIIVNKPAGLVVHPGAGNPTGTLMNALLHRHPDLAAVPRAGIVHRIDKDTTGLLVVARTIEAQHTLVSDLQERTIGRTYLALVHGVPQVGGGLGGRSGNGQGGQSGGGLGGQSDGEQGRGIIDAPVARHPTARTRMAVRQDGKSAITLYRVERQFAGICSLLRCELETGRTHQIRVHMQSIGHPLVGDATYGGRQQHAKGQARDGAESLQNLLRGFKRQALHATRLKLNHPVTAEPMTYEAPPPEDFAALLAEADSHE